MTAIDKSNSQDSGAAFSRDDDCVRFMKSIIYIFGAPYPEWRKPFTACRFVAVVSPERESCRHPQGPRRCVPVETTGHRLEALLAGFAEFYLATPLRFEHL